MTDSKSKGAARGGRPLLAMTGLLLLASCDDEAAKARDRQARERAAWEQAQREVVRDQARTQAREARSKTLAALQVFKTFAAKASRDPRGSGGDHVECHTGKDPDAGWCDNYLTQGGLTLGTRWWANAPDAVQIEGYYLPKGELECSDLDASARLIRRWKWESARKVQTRCTIGGQFAGFQALIQAAESATHVELFSPAYVARNPEMVETFETQGTTLDGGNR